MRPDKNLLVPIFLLLSLQFANGQIWPKTFFQSKAIYGNSILGCYDRGYMIGGTYLTSSGNPVNGCLIKTDRNADLLWFKRLGNYNDGTYVNDVSQTSDGGYIISGSTNVTDYAGDPFVMKLNACGEREWCRIYRAVPDRWDNAQRVIQTTSGYIVLVRYGNSMWGRDITSLYKLNMSGDLEWQQFYCQNDTLMMDPEGSDLLISADNHYIITGFCYYPEPDSIWPKYDRPLIIKVDSTGEAEWELPWTKIAGNPFIGKSYQSILDNNMNIYSCGDHYYYPADPYALPVMIKTDTEGNPCNYFNVLQTNRLCEIHGIKWLQDSTIVLHGGWLKEYGNIFQIGILKVNKGGYLLDSVQIDSEYSDYYPNDATVDADNKIVLLQSNVFSGKFHPYVWKFNSDLEYDTLYFSPLVYDSLCPHAIASDTIPLDCVIVGVDEPIKMAETGHLKVWPNPASDVLHIIIPDKLEAVDETPVYNLTTVYHQWRSATIEVYDLFGHKMFDKEIKQGSTEIEANVSTWPHGMYVVRLVYNGRSVTDEKVLVE